MGKIGSEHGTGEKRGHSQLEGRPGRPSRQAGQKKKRKRVIKHETTELELSDDHLQEWVVEFEGGESGHRARGQNARLNAMSRGVCLKKIKESVQALERWPEGLGEGQSKMGNVQGTKTTQFEPERGQESRAHAGWVGVGQGLVPCPSACTHRRGRGGSALYTLACM